MRTREELLKGLSELGLGPPSTTDFRSLEVLIDIRDELVAQGKPTEAPGPVSHAGCMEREQRLSDQRDAALAEAKQREAELAWYRKAENGFAEVAKAVGLISETGSRIFEITECVRRVKDHVASSDAHDALRTRLSEYLGAQVISNDRIVELVRELGSLAQDRKAEIDRVAACVNVCAELVKLLKVPDHTHLAEAVRDRQTKVDALEGVCRDLRADRDTLKAGFIAVTERERVLLQRVAELEHEVNAHAIRGGQP